MSWFRQPYSKHQNRIASVILLPVTVLVGLSFFEPRYPRFDAVRYVGYAATLLEHGTFAKWPGNGAQAPQPGRGHAPLYPTWLASLALIDADFGKTVHCVAENAANNVWCPFHMGFAVTAQLFLAGIFYCASWLLAVRLSGSISLGWLAAAFAYFCNSPLSYANQLLTEALIMPLGALFILFLVLGYAGGRRWWFLAAGLTLGAMALTRPAYAYLFYAIAAVLAATCFRTRRKLVYWATTLFFLGYGAMVAPWMLRNSHHFDEAALTSGYAADILAQRVAYNRMTLGELGIALVYWFPDFGNDMARAISEDASRHLGWGEDSYYELGKSVIYPRLRGQFESDEAVLRHLIRSEVLARPVKHLLVSLPLAWRGLFVAKYWGLVGVICLAFVLYRWRQAGGKALLIGCLPLAFMVLFHAQVSVSIPRYNLPLIPIMAYAMAWTAARLTRNVSMRLAKP